MLSRYQYTAISLLILVTYLPNAVIDPLLTPTPYQHTITLSWSDHDPNLTPTEPIICACHVTSSIRFGTSQGCSHKWYINVCITSNQLQQSDCSSIGHCRNGEWHCFGGRIRYIVPLLYYIPCYIPCISQIYYLMHSVPASPLSYIPLKTLVDLIL